MFCWKITKVYRGKIMKREENERMSVVVMGVFLEVNLYGKGEEIRQGHGGLLRVYGARPKRWRGW